MKKILLTDHPWPDVAIESAIINAAGYELIATQIPPGDARQVEMFVADHDPVAIMTCWARVSAAAIACPSSLKVVSRLGVGLDNIAIDAATARGAWVTNVPDYCVEEVSDHAIAMLLNYTRGIDDFNRKVKRGEWNPSSAQLLRLRNLTVGIVGFGRIARATAQKLANGFGCRVLVNAPSVLRSPEMLPPNLRAATLGEIQREAHAVILHLPLTTESHHLIDTSFLAACARRPYIINVSRGGLIDNRALVSALESKQISGAALDVVEGEPSPPQELLECDNVVMTPHIAFTSDASLRQLREEATQDVVRVLRGEPPLNPCNQPGITR